MIEIVCCFLVVIAGFCFLSLSTETNELDRNDIKLVLSLAAIGAIPFILCWAIGALL